MCFAINKPHLQYTKHDCRPIWQPLVSVHFENQPAVILLLCSCELGLLCNTSLWLTKGQNKDLAASRWQAKRSFPLFLVHLNWAQDFFYEVRQIKVLHYERKTVELHYKQRDHIGL